MAPHSDEPGAGFSITLGELAHLVGGTLEGDGDRSVRDIAGLLDAGPDDVSFCAMSTYRSRLRETAAAAVIVAGDFERPDGASSDLALIRVENPYLAVATVVRRFHPEETPGPGVHPSAVIAESAILGEDVSIGARAVIGEECKIGDNTRIEAGCALADGVEIGAECRLYPNVTVYPGVLLGERVAVHAGAVIGADGFGYAFDGERHVKIPQVGGVVVEDDVEIGANACIDRAALGVTRIGRGTKIDNLVQIGHNCDVGPDSILCGQVGVGGSTRIGRGVMIGGQAGVGGHLELGAGAMVAGHSGVTSSVPEGARVGGYPHLEAALWRRVVASLRSLPGLARRVRRIEAQLAAQDEEEE